MAQQALPAGTTPAEPSSGCSTPNGWGWAGLKATFWFIAFIFLLGVVPNYAYYFTVSDTIQVGYNAISPINWCPAANEDLPCPAPAGAVVPWEASAARARAAAARDGCRGRPVGRQPVRRGWSVGHRRRRGRERQRGRLGRQPDRVAGRARRCPSRAPRPPPSRSSGVPYIIGGLDASGAPTTTVYMGTVEDGVIQTGRSPTARTAPWT